MESIPLRRSVGSARLFGLLVIFPLLALTAMAVAPLEAAHAQPPSSGVTVNAVNQFGDAIPGDYYTVSETFYGAVYDQGNAVVATGVTASTFSAAAGSTYTIQVYGYGSCAFSHWTTLSWSAAVGK